MFAFNTHIRMLADKTRVEAYRKAIFQTVRKGDIVVDIGTGTGILAFFALQAGARKVFAIETGPIIDVARKIAKDNGFLHKIEFIQQDSRNTQITEKFDVVITETIGNFGINEEIVEILSDAKKRFLKKEGKMIPSDLSLNVVPVSFVKHHPFDFPEKSFCHLNLSHIKELAANNVHNLHVTSSNHPVLLSQPSKVFTISFYRCDSLNFPLHMNTHFRVTQNGDYHGVMLFPVITLSKGNILSFYKNNRFLLTHWDIPFFPISDKIKLRIGDRISCHITFTEKNGFIWQHIIERENAKGVDKRVANQLSTFGLPSLRHLINIFF